MRQRELLYFKASVFVNFFCFALLGEGTQGKIKILLHTKPEQTVNFLKLN